MKDSNHTLKRSVWTAGILAMGAITLLAEEVFVTSYIGSAGADLTPCPHSCSTGFSVAGSNSSSTALPNPVPADLRKVIFGKEPGASWTVTPRDVTYTSELGNSYAFTSLNYTSVYRIYLTKGQTIAESTNVVVTMTATGGALANVNGVGSPAIVIDAFQASKPDNVWIHVGYITNSIANPTLTFAHTGGECSNLQRWYADTVRFSSFDPPWVKLHYIVTGDIATFTWMGNCTLQSKSALGDGSWIDVAATSGYQVSLSSTTSTFYRLRLNF